MMKCEYCGAPMKPWWDERTGAYRCTSEDCTDPEYQRDPKCRTLQYPKEEE